MVGAAVGLTVVCANLATAFVVGIFYFCSILTKVERMDFASDGLCAIMVLHMVVTVGYVWWSAEKEMRRERVLR